MNTITNGNSYPIFAPNQVLKYTDLNSLVDYLDQQNRLTRTYLIGMGIICGLELNSTYQKGQAQILISEGCGVTSEGFLIALSNTVLTHYQLEQSVTVDLFNPTVPIAPTTPSPQVKVTELFSQEGTNHLPLHQTPEGNQRDESAFRSFLTNQVLIVAWEIQDAQRDSCLVDCDDRGKDRSFRLRFFLLPQLQTQTTSISPLSAESLLRKGYEIDQLGATWSSFSTQELFEARYNFLKNFDPKVLRFGHALEKNDSNQSIDIVRLTNITDYKTFVQNYYKVCTQAIAEISKSFPQLFRLFSPFFSALHPLNTDFSGLRDRLIARLNAIVPASMRPSTSLISATREQGAVEQVEAQYALQYFYDYLSQLVAAYGELVETAFDLMDDCPPEMQRFPKFLLLGLVPSPNTVTEVCAIPSAYRSHFTQPPLYNGNSQRTKQVRHLYDRLVRLCNADSFYLLPFYDTPLKITPSKERSVPLSEQAIPYYLNYPNLYRYWSYDDCRKGISDRHPAYFYPLQSNAPFIVGRDLTYRLDEANFYRIEGHIGEGKAVALQRLHDYQQLYNLPFDAIVLKLGTLASLNDLTLSGQFDDLEADFGRMKDKFQKLWLKYQETWEKNVFLQTLKKVFFNQDSLTAISYTQLFNPVLVLASQAEAYHFISVPGNRYHLQLRNAAGNQIARFVTESEGQLIDLAIDFLELSEVEIAAEQKRITKDLMACLGLGKITYGVSPQASNNQVSYYVRLSVEDELNLPQGSVSINLLTLTYFSVNSVGIQPHINQSEFQDFETLYGLLRDIPEDYATNLPFQMGDRLAADCLNYFELKGLMEAYQHRLEKLMELHLFHKFAQYHSGMEHLGGVPKGGTFILVYVDGRDLVNTLLTADRNLQYQARTPALKNLLQFPIDSAKEGRISKELLNREDIVVADFCLPYRCCSNTPVVNYLLAQPRPIVLLEKTVFCEGDATRYEFILDPADGTLKGEGVVIPPKDDRDYGKPYFQPSLIEQNIGREVAITFTYVVKGSYDTLTVTIYPEPEANLSLGDRFCADAPSVPIALSPVDPRIEIVHLTIDGRSSSITNPVFDPKLYAKEEPHRVEIVVQIRDRLTKCTNEISHTVTVYPLPDTEFSLNPEPIEGRYCAGTGDKSIREVVLEPDHPNVSDHFTVNDQPLPTGRINLNDYAQIKKPVDLLLVHYAKGEGDCTAQSQPRKITIFPLPDASFQPDVDSVCANAEPVALNPLQLGGTFRVIDPQGKEIKNAIVGDPPQFIPTAVPLGKAKSVTVKIEYTLVGAGNCENTITHTVTVYPLPDTGFSLKPKSIEGGYCAGEGGESVREVVLQPDRPNVSNRFTVNDQELLSKRIDLNDYADIKEPVNLILVHYAEGSGGCTAQSNPQTITIFPLPDASFQPAVDSVCANAEPVLLNPTQKGGIFRVHDPQGKEIKGAIVGDPPQFIPTAVPLGKADSVTVKIERTLVSRGNCIAQSEREITVRKVPVGSFDLSISSSNPNGFLVQVSNIQPAGEVPYDFEWFFGSGIPSPANPRNQTFTVSYSYANLKGVDNIAISLTVNNLKCSSVVSKQILIPLFR
jgi:hypothetical protein